MEEPATHHGERQIEEIGPADLLVGILDTAHANPETPGNTKGASMVREALEKFAKPMRTVVVDGSLQTGDSRDASVAPGGIETHSTVSGGYSFTVVPAPAGPEPSSPAQGIAASYRSMFALGEQLSAKVCCVIASNLETVTARWIYRLSQPALELGYDVVAPCYVHGPFEGVLNASIIRPLHCALYGQNFQNPIGPDVSLSRRAVQRMLASLNPKGSEFPLISLLPSVIPADLKTCQTYVGRRAYPATDWSAVSSLLPAILGPIFSAIERDAAIWQHVRGLRPVPTFGDADSAVPETESIDIPRMMESFQLGIRDLREIYGLVLPPSSLLELTKLARLGPDKFRIPDSLWARVVYDFAVSHHLRTLNRDHLLRSLTPLYLGWIASYGLELQTEPISGRLPLSRLAPAFEAAKPYFVSRWRWPDRFNP